MRRIAILKEKWDHHLTGPAWITLAALLWGTDSLFRYPIADKIDPLALVFAEHLCGTVILLGWLMLHPKREKIRLGRREWIAALVIGMGGSAVATTIYTASFRYVNPSVSVLLQKLQPVLVVVIAYFILKEKPDRRKIAWSCVALFSGIILSFPDFNFNLFEEGQRLHTKGILYSFLASVLWGAATVGGKVLMQKVSYTAATFLRYSIGLCTLAALLGVSAQGGVFTPLYSQSFIGPVIYLSLFSGIFPMWIYYRGLKSTPAIISTFIELLYPVSAVILNALILGTKLNAVQILASLVLLFAVTKISLARS